MRKPFDWAPRCGVLALLLILLPPPDASAQSQPHPGQSATQEKAVPAQPAVTPADSITVPDGTPLTLQLVSELSSGTAKVGDTVEFTTPYPLRINGLVVLPKGTAVSGTVGQVSHPGKLMRSGGVKVVVEKLVLPNGEIVALHLSKSASGKPQRLPAKRTPGPCDASCGDAGAAGLILLPMMLFWKGDDQVYPAGTQTTAYFNGPHNFDRAALLKMQPPPYKGPAQVFFTATTGTREVLFCGQERLGHLSVHIRLELNPGTYWFSTRMESAKGSCRVKAQPVDLEVHEDHQYWVQREGHGLVVKDTQRHQAEFDIVQNVWQATDDALQNAWLRTHTGLDSCPRAPTP